MVAKRKLKEISFSIQNASPKELNVSSLHGAGEGKKTAYRRWPA